MKSFKEYLKEETKLEEAKKPKEVKLSFSDEIDQNKLVRTKEGKAKIDSNIFNWILNKWKSLYTITDETTAIRQQKIEMHLRTKHMTITPFGDVLLFLIRSNNNNDIIKKYYKL